jgi:hypothetical protein
MDLLFAFHSEIDQERAASSGVHAFSNPGFLFPDRSGSTLSRFIISRVAAKYQ